MVNNTITSVGRFIDISAIFILFFFVIVSKVANLQQLASFLKRYFKVGNLNHLGILFND